VVVVDIVLVVAVAVVVVVVGNTVAVAWGTIVLCLYFSFLVVVAFRSCCPLWRMVSSTPCILGCLAVAVIAVVQHSPIGCRLLLVFVLGAIDVVVVRSPWLLVVLVV